LPTIGMILLAVFLLMSVADTGFTYELSTKTIRSQKKCIETDISRKKVLLTLDSVEFRAWINNEVKATIEAGNTQCIVTIEPEIIPEERIRKALKTEIEKMEQRLSGLKMPKEPFAVKLFRRIFSPLLENRGLGPLQNGHS
jgi:hypothetical protein